MPGPAGSGLAQKVGPSRKYLGPQNCLFTFVKGFDGGTVHMACAFYHHFDNDVWATMGLTAQCR